jgi:hypothetical protein
MTMLALNVGNYVPLHFEFSAVAVYETIFEVGFALLIYTT